MIKVQRLRIGFIFLKIFQVKNYYIKTLGLNDIHITSKPWNLTEMCHGT